VLKALKQLQKIDPKSAEGHFQLVKFLHGLSQGGTIEGLHPTTKSVLFAEAKTLQQGAGGSSAKEVNDQYMKTQTSNLAARLAGT